MSKLTLFLVVLLLVCLLSPSAAWRRRRRRRRRSCGAVHCRWGAWGSYGPCSATCGPGTQTRSRGIAVNPSCGGSGCSGPSTSSRACNQRCCPVNCQLGPWEGFGGCSATCGGGMQSRMRNIAVPSKCGGTPCSDDRFDTKPCSTQCCVINCRWSSWGNYNACPVTCGGGTQSRKRRIEQQPVCGGIPCLGSSSDKKKCSTQCCPVDCRWTGWSEFSECSVSCGGGTQSRKRHVEVEQSCGGTQCSGLDTETKQCNSQCCKVDCSWGPWSEYGPCTRTCGVGSEDRTRSIAIYQQCGGEPCAGVSFDSRDCNAGCCPVDCRWESWSEFSECSVSCGGGTMERTRSIGTNADCGGSECVGTREETKACNEHHCPVHCSWSDWSEWGDCTVTCGGGTETRSRKVDVIQQHGGQMCQGDNSQTRNCNEDCCAVDCVWDDWVSWTSCSKSCERGSQTRRRKILIPSACGGAQCEGNLIDEQSCNDVCCPVDCAYSEWSEWRSCSKTCGEGIQGRSRNVIREPSCEGQNCIDDTTEERKCNAGCCPVNCEMTRWENWSECSLSCGSSGVQTRTRSVAIFPQCNGLPCPEDTMETQPCNRICLNGATLDRERGCLCTSRWSGTCCDEDENECENNSHDCHKYSDCVNEHGSYSCQCKKGYSGDGFFCEDINECEIDDGGCNGPFMACENTPGSYMCHCEGTRVMVDGRCLETDLCEKGEDECHDMAQCKSTPGSYLCTCIEGFTGDGISCEDINECGSGLHCNGPFMSCENSYGSFVCYCQQSLKLMDGECKDTNECEAGTDRCHEMAQCINEPGKYSCICNDGYIGDGYTCEDINECTTGLHDCKALFMGCENTDGSYVCYCQQSLTLSDGECVETGEQSP